MPCHTRMKLLLRGLLWLFVLDFGFMVTSLEPGFLDFDNLPDTNFSCVGKVIGGYYADLETSCQMFHVCTIGQLDEPMDIRFLCLNGTVFDQETRVCERIDEVDCSKSEQFYSLNLELYGNTQPPILEESPETDVPELQIPKKFTTTTTTTTARPTVVQTPRQNFIITTSKSTTTTMVAARPLSTAPHVPHVIHVPQVQQLLIPQTPKPPQPQPQLHFGSGPQQNAPSDIRYNPEEYKIALSNEGPPSIRSQVNLNHNGNTNSNSNPNSNSANAAGGNAGKPISFQTFSDNNKRVIVTTHTTVYKSEKQPVTTSVPAPPTKTQVEADKQEDYDGELSDSTEDSYGYEYHSQQHQPETLKLAQYQSPTETLPKTYQFRPPPFRPSQELVDDSYKPSTYRSVFHPATNNPLKVNYNHPRAGPTTYRNHYGYFNHGSLKQLNDKQRIPALPTLAPLTFSSPAPFSLRRHVETKRFIDHRAQEQQFQHQPHRQHQQFQRLHHLPHQQQEASQQQLVHHLQPPRIVISASASVSDASGRKFNYSLGTIGDTRFFGQAPQSYDDYKEDDVGLDPFYHDVPKVRLKRQAPQLEPQTEQDGGYRSVEEAGEKEAIDVLKFLFNWYNNHERNQPNVDSSTNIKKIHNAPHIKSETITEINDALTPKYVPNQIYQDQIQPEDQLDQLDQDLYEDFDINLKQAQYAGVQRQEFKKPYLSLQLLKPPFEGQQSYEQDQSTVKFESQKTTAMEAIIITEKTGTTPTSTTTTTVPPPLSSKYKQDSSYYDYVDDNYEPITYQEEIREQKVTEAKEIKNQHQAQALADYQQFKEGFLEYYPDDNLKNTKEYVEQNYSLSEYVDDNDEPNVYQGPKGYEEPAVEKNTEILTIPDTLTTLKVPIGVNNGQSFDKNVNNYYYDRYNQNIQKQFSTVLNNEATITTPIPTNPTGANSTLLPQPASGGKIEYPIYSRSQYKIAEKDTEATPTLVVTENYQQVLGILGITTHGTTKPEIVKSVVDYVETPKVKPRIHNRGKARFSLKDVADVPDDVVFIRKPQHSRSTASSIMLTTLPTIPTLPMQRTTIFKHVTGRTTSYPSTVSEIPGTERLESTTEDYQYTLNLNRRTEEMDPEEKTVSTVFQQTTIPISYIPTNQELQTSPEDNFGDNLNDINQSFAKLGEVTTSEFPSETINDVTIPIQESTEKYTTIQLQTLEEEESTKSVFEIKTMVNLTVDDDKEKLSTTVTVPTTTVDDLEKEAETERTLIENDDVTTTSTEPTTEETTVRPTTLPPPTTSTVTTTLSPYTIPPRTPKSRQESQRRRSKSRFRQSQYVPSSSTTSTTSTTTEPPKIRLVTYSHPGFTTKFPSSLGFSTSTQPTSQYLSTTPRKPTLNEEIIDAIKSKISDSRNIEFNVNAFTANLAYRVKTTPITLLYSSDHHPALHFFKTSSHAKEENSSTKESDIPPSTDPSLSKSALPTLGNENLRRTNQLPTTPISQSTAINVRKQVKHRKYTFSCIDKEVNQFYSDPRDCRLFHYCTRGFTRTQYLDMKFVCDLGTFFDDTRLVCTKEKPTRCA